MIRKSKIAAGLVGLFLVAASTFGAVSASASDVLVCTVQGSVSIASPGITNTSAATTGTFDSTTLNCTGVGAGAGTWTIKASFGSPAETCADSLGGSGSFTTGSKDPSGNAATGGFTFDRVGTAVAVQGSITAAGHTYPFVAGLIFVPTNGVCSNPTLTAGTTAANIAAGSTAVIS